MLQASCRGELFSDAAKQDAKVPVSHEDQMSTLRQVRCNVMTECMHMHGPIALMQVTHGLAISCHKLSLVHAMHIHC